MIEHLVASHRYCKKAEGRVRLEASLGAPLVGQKADVVGRKGTSDDSCLAKCRTAFLILGYRHNRIGLMHLLFYYPEPKSDPKKIYAADPRPSP